MSSKIQDNRSIKITNGELVEYILNDPFYGAL